MPGACFLKFTPIYRQMGNNARRWQLCAHHVAIATRDDPAAMITFNATLSNAVVTNNVGVLKELLKAGASVNSCDSAFNTVGDFTILSCAA